MDNPYTSPAEVEQAATTGLPLPPRTPSRAVRHVRIVSLLMIGEGVCEGLLAALCFVFGVTATFLFQHEEVREQSGMNANFVWLVMGVYFGAAVLHAVLAVLHVFAGVRNYQFRSRTLGIVGLASGIATVLAAFCVLTAVPLAVYGMIVYFNENVTKAFLMRDAGYSVEEIKKTFY